MGYFNWSSCYVWEPGGTTIIPFDNNMISTLKARLVSINLVLVLLVVSLGTWGKQRTKQPAPKSSGGQDLEEPRVAPWPNTAPAESSGQGIDEHKWWYVRSPELPTLKELLRVLPRQASAESFCQGLEEQRSCYVQSPEPQTLKELPRILPRQGSPQADVLDPFGSIEPCQPCSPAWASPVEDAVPHLYEDFKPCQPHIPALASPVEDVFPYTKDNPPHSSDPAWSVWYSKFKDQIFLHVDEVIGYV